MRLCSKCETENPDENKVCFACKAFLPKPELKGKRNKEQRARRLCQQAGIDPDDDELGLLMAEHAISGNQGDRNNFLKKYAPAPAPDETDEVFGLTLQADTMEELLKNVHIMDKLLEMPERTDTMITKQIKGSADAN